MDPFGRCLGREYVGRDEPVGRRMFFRLVVSGQPFHSTQVSPTSSMGAAMGEPSLDLVLGACRGGFAVFGRWVAPPSLASGLVVDSHW